MNTFVFRQFFIKVTKFLKYLLFILSITLIIGCKTDYKQTVTYFGGKIINPKTNFVLLYSQDKVIDSLFLDSDNKFIGKYINFKKGLYYFVHGLERQYVYIEPKDSILIRLNTWGVFDESLVFSGIGAEKNNILIDFFLENEKDNKAINFHSFFSLESDIFKSKLDSILALRQKKIDAFRLKNTKLTKSYLNLLDVAAKYPIYSKFEKYSNIHRKVSDNIYIETSSSFYKYRENIDINNNDLLYFGAYSRYIVRRLCNNVHTQGFRSGTKEFIVALLNSIDKNIYKEKLKNTFLKEMLINDFNINSICNINDEAFHTFFKLSSNTNDKKMVQRLLNDVKNLRKGSNLVDFEIIDYNKKTHSIKKIIRHKNSIIYFWSPKHTSNIYLSSRVNYLTKKFPKVNFVGVKITSTNSNPAKGIDIKNQFYIDQYSKANIFLTSKLPRTILVNKKGTLINSYTSINNHIIHKQIKELQKN